MEPFRVILPFVIIYRLKAPCVPDLSIVHEERAWCGRMVNLIPSEMKSRLYGDCTSLCYFVLLLNLQIKFDLLVKGLVHVYLGNF